MAFTATDSTNESRAFSVGPVKFQLMNYTVLSGATTGTVTADKLSKLKHVAVLGGKVTNTAAPTYSGNVATLAFTVPAETAASRTIDGVLYTAVAQQGAGGNNITLQIVDGTGDTPAVTPGNETVTVTGSAIVVHVDPTPSTGSTRTQVKAAVVASAAASALVTPSTVTSGTTVATVTAATHLQSGVTGGARGSLLCIGV